MPQTVTDPAPIARVNDPEQKAVLLYDRRELHGESVTWSLAKLGTPVTRAAKDELLPCLEKEKAPFVFVSPDMAETTRNFIKKKNIDATMVLLANLEDTGIFQHQPVINVPAYTVSIANILNGTQEGLKKEWTEIGFTAPDARILIVDDIASNLEVAKGFLSLYRVNIDTASDGQEAVRMAQENSYDIIFMDHMMPRMDGIEAAVAIRSLGMDTPIIALTANAVSGMKDRFIEKGFNDYLSKPIGIAKLDEVIARWIPLEKRVEIESPLRRGSAESTGLTIPGIDVARGIDLTGGTEAGYRKVLTQFYKDAAERLPIFAESPIGEDISLFIAQAHAIKSAAATIGAAEVSTEAEVLEAAGKAGDMAAIRETLADFYRHLVELIEGIGTVLAEQSGEKDAGGEWKGSIAAPLSALRTALETKNMKEIDRLLEEIEELPLDAGTGEQIHAVSDKVLMGEYEGAVKAITVLLAEGELNYGNS
jgi:CheY-like chemotaxis protein